MELNQGVDVSYIMPCTKVIRDIFPKDLPTAFLGILQEMGRTQEKDYFHAI